MMMSIPQDTFMRHTRQTGHLSAMFNEHEATNMYEYDVSNRHRQAYRHEIKYALTLTCMKSVTRTISLFTKHLTEEQRL